MILPAAIGMKIGQTFKSVILELLVLVSDVYYLFPIIRKHLLVPLILPYFIAFFGLVSIFEPLKSRYIEERADQTLCDILKWFNEKLKQECWLSI